MQFNEALVRSTIINMPVFDVDGKEIGIVTEIEITDEDDLYAKVNMGRLETGTCKYCTEDENGQDKTG